MTGNDTFWSFLEYVGDSSLAAIEWTQSFPKSYPFLTAYLHVTDEATETIGCPCTAGCRHQIFRYPNGKITAEGDDCLCETTTLNIQDIVRYRFNARQLCKDIAKFLKLDECYTKLGTACHQIADWHPRRQTLRHIYLCYGCTSILLAQRVDMIINRDREMPIIILPSRRFCTSLQRNTVSAVKGDIYFLSDFLTIQKGGLSLCGNSPFVMPTQSVSSMGDRIHIALPSGSSWVDIGLYYNEEGNYFEVRVKGRGNYEALSFENMGLSKGVHKPKLSYVLLTLFAKNKDDGIRLHKNDRNKYNAPKNELSRCLQEIFNLSTEPFRPLNIPHQHSKSDSSGWIPFLTIRTTDWLKEQQDTAFIDKKLHHSYGDNF